MIKENKGKIKKVRKPKNPDGNMGEVLAALGAIGAKLQEQDERLDELDDKDVAGRAKLLIASLAYDTPDKRMSELTRIPLTAVDPLVTDITLDALLNEDVQAGKVSLGEIERLSYFQLMRSVGGEHLKKARETAEEEKAVEGEKGAALDM